MTYILQSYKMNQDFIHSEIENCLNSLYHTNDMLFDYWLSELFDENDNEVVEMWNEFNLKEMYADVDVSNQAYMMKLV